MRCAIEKNRYSPSIFSNGFLFVSGQIRQREDGSPEPDLEAQVRLALENLNAIRLRYLRAASTNAARSWLKRCASSRNGAWPEFA